MRKKKNCTVVTKTKTVRWLGWQVLCSVPFCCRPFSHWKLQDNYRPVDHLVNWKVYLQAIKCTVGCLYSTIRTFLILPLILGQITPRYRRFSYLSIPLGDVLHTTIHLTKYNSHLSLLVKGYKEVMEIIKVITNNYFLSIHMSSNKDQLSGKSLGSQLFLKEVVHFSSNLK